MKSRWKRFLPLAVFAVLVIVMGVAVMKPHKKVSPFLDKPLPDFSMPLLDIKKKSFSSSGISGEVVVLNFFASWCAPCKAEMGVLRDLKDKSGVPIYGISYKDKIPQTKSFLHEFGNPYQEIGIDAAGQVAMDFGVTGVPETFVIDRRGIVRYRLQGPLTTEESTESLLPLIQKLKAEK